MGLFGFFFGGLIAWFVTFALIFLIVKFAIAPTLEKAIANLDPGIDKVSTEKYRQGQEDGRYRLSALRK